MENNTDNLYDATVDIPGRRMFLYDLAEWKNGLAFKKIDFSDEGVPVIKIAELNGGISSNTSYTKGVYSDDVHLFKGDMVFSWSGNPQTSIDIFRFKLSEGWLNQHIFKVTPKEEIIDEDYFYYLMKWLKPIFTKIASNKQTTGLGHVTIKDLKQLEVVVPSLDVQKKVASVLKKFDDCIDVNVEIIENLVNQVRALYKERFCDSIPDTDTLWKEVTLNDIVEISTRTFSPEKNPGVDVEHYSIPSYDEVHFPVFENADDIKSNKYRVNKNSILVSKLNPSIKRIWRPYCLTENPVCSTEFIVYEAKNKKYKDFLYALLDSKPFMDHLCSTVTGSTGSRQRAMPKATLEYSFKMAPDDEITRFCEDVKPMCENMDRCAVENYKLAEMRNALIPMVLSGQIKL